MPSPPQTPSPGPSLPLSAVAARLAANRSSLPINLSGSSSQHHHHNIPSDIDINININPPRQPKSRYFSSPATAPPPPPPPPTPNQPLSSHVPPSGDPRRQITRLPKPSFSDPDCISKWTPIWDGPSRNLLLHKHRSTIGLQAGQTLVAYGVLKLSVLSGSITISGATLSSASSTPIDIFAPPSHPLPPIQANIPGPSELSVPSSSPFTDTSFCAIVQLDDLQTGIEAIDELWTAHGLKRRLWTPPAGPVRGHTWALVLGPTPDVAALRVPPSWACGLSELGAEPAGDEPAIYMVEGPQAVGKSTFASLLLNALLARHPRVALLDLDPGQPVFGPPTLVSLHVLSTPVVGPAFCRLARPGGNQLGECSSSVYIGAVTAKNCRARYIGAAEQLMELYRTQHATGRSEPLGPRRRSRRPPAPPPVPLVVNTMGSFKGFGADVLAQLVEIVKPCRLFSFSDAQPDPRPITTTRLEATGAAGGAARLTAADKRTLGLLGYLHSCAQTSSGSGLFVDKWQFEQALYTRRPFEVEPGPIRLPDHPELDHDHLGYVLNGTLIGLVERSEGIWIGFAVVRAVVASRRALWIVTPTCISEDQEVEFIKFEEPEVPTVCYLIASSCKGSSGGLEQVVPYFERIGGGGSSSSKKKKENHGRIGNGNGIVMRNNCNGEEEIGKVFSSGGSCSISRVGAERKRVRRNVQRRKFG